MSELVRQIYLQRGILLANIIVCLVVSFLLLIFSRNYVWRKDRISLFSFLFNLNERQLITVGLLITRFIYTFVITIVKSDLNAGYLIVYILYALLIGYLNYDLKELGLEAGYGVISYAAIFLERYLINYYSQVSRESIYVVLILAITSFITLFAFLKIVTSYEAVIKKRKNIKNIMRKEA